MAETQRDLQGWQVVTTDEHGNVVHDNRRRSRKRGVENVYLQRESDAVSFGRGDVVIMDDATTGTYSVYLVHELRLNTLNNVVELWAFSFLRWFELKPLLWYKQFDKELVEQNKPMEFYKQKFLKEVDKDELYLTAELSEIWLKDFIGVGNIVTQNEKFDPKFKMKHDVDFFVRYICEPTADHFAKIDIFKEIKRIKEMEPKQSEEHLKRISVPKTSRGATVVGSSRSKASSLQMSAPSSTTNKKVPMKESRVSPDITKEEKDEKKAVTKKEKPNRSEQIVKGMLQPKAIAPEKKRLEDPSSQPPPLQDEHLSRPSSREVTSLFYHDSDEEENSQPIPKLSKGTKPQVLDIGMDENDSSDYASAEDKTPAELADEKSEDKEEEEETQEEKEQDEEYSENEVETDESQGNGVTGHEFDLETIEGEKEEDHDDSEENISVPKRGNRNIAVDDEADVYSAGTKRKLTVETTDDEKRKSAKKSSDQSPSIISDQKPLSRTEQAKRNINAVKEKYDKILQKLDAKTTTSIDASDFSTNSGLDVAGLENRLRSSSREDSEETLFSKIPKEALESIDAMQQAIVNIFDENAVSSLTVAKQQYASIYANLFHYIESGESKALYIVGNPGVGRRQTVDAVITELGISSEQTELPIFKTVNLSGLTIGDSELFYQKLWEQISGEELIPGAALEALEYYFQHVPKNKKRPIIITLDDLDNLIIKGKNVLYNFFNWTTYINAKVCVIAISSSIDLPERLLGKQVCSRIDLTKIPFMKYNRQEVEKIIAFKLKGINKSCFFINTETGQIKFIDKISGEDGNVDEDKSKLLKVRLKISNRTIESGAENIAAVCTDTRSALEYCSKAVEFAQLDYLKKKGFIRDEQDDMTNNIKEAIEHDLSGKQIKKVHMHHILQALNTMVATSLLETINNTSLLGKVFLCGLYYYIKKNGPMRVFSKNVLEETLLLMEHNKDNVFIAKFIDCLFPKNIKPTLEILQAIHWFRVLQDLIDGGVMSMNLKSKIRHIEIHMPLQDLKRSLEGYFGILHEF
ncbi:chromatin-silencing protein SIR3 NDAI_0J02740 [Naumovozyma dairenensis CBS 421]|uniref:Origin recognition complex subunit 1 n=1 Tax=Naumovozyma dairenensis (strain ATCC 10597 / BCRC 20456 / CBS 421 / NBRC 0211 / NRRL Y-12639) TaxID=1071378 RepID=G0WH88_NAUDC|nr:hypothetical protein NDAI_0J02740 [Naumovozyma dairenensis CBS 421]CCD27166.1 hypothetical protein NDAI_0J02740 [Naumovozyma dairenensis CBS 421]